MRIIVNNKTSLLMLIQHLNTIKTFTSLPETRATLNECLDKLRAQAESMKDE